MEVLLRYLPPSFLISIISLTLTSSLVATEESVTEDPLSVDAVFNFIDFQTMQVNLRHGTPTNRYIAQENTAVEIDATHDFRKLRAYLYSNALAAIVLTHRGIAENNQDHLDKAAGIFRTFNQHQYTEEVCSVPVEECNNFPHLAGAFPNQLVAEDYYLSNPGPTEPYTGENGLWMVRHGNNAWYLMALGYYTLETGDRQFVPVLRALADYFISDRAQVNKVGSSKNGAILFGWGNLSPPRLPNYRKLFTSTEHQTEAFAGLIYAAEVIKDEVDGAEKQLQYLNSASRIFRFAINKLYNPNHRRSDRKRGTFFHVGLDPRGKPSRVLPSLDAQTWTYLSFARALEGVKDISGVLDYAWENMYGENPDPDDPPGVGQVFGQTPTRAPVMGRGALWYEGDKGIWLTGSAELVQSFKLAHAMTGKRRFGVRAQIVFDDMSKMVWLDDEIRTSSKTWSWPQGGFPSFSDHYVANSEPSSLGMGEKMPSIEPTAWRYFNLVDFNPYAVEISTPLPAPQNVTIVDGPSGVKLRWSPDPLAVSYVIERDDLDEPIAYVGNLRNAVSTLTYSDSTMQCSDCSYKITPRDLTGQLGTSAAAQR